MIDLDFYETLDCKLPGGDIASLDRTIISERMLYLTRISMDGLEDMHEYSKDKRLYKYFEFEPFKDINETKVYLQKLIDRVGNELNNRTYMYWFIRTIKDNKIIGTIGLVEIDVYRGAAGWGYAISPNYQGQGYILEAQLLVSSYFFEILKMNRLWGVTPSDNDPTISSVFSAGFQKEGILRDYYKYSNGERKDGLIYSLLAKDYFSMNKSTKNESGREIINLDQLKKIFATVFKMHEEDINEHSSMKTVAGWDSLNHITLILQIEKATGFKFKPREIAQAISIKSILKIINERN